MIMGISGKSEAHYYRNK